ncbi:hypothetical protein LSH36_61g00029 [Paralvinella palmiformis]|uniref:Uncharacterized protein n=1 Tax=Paralvinella palmiformis TaxID=53620 RepID=A0AAD9K4I5_9ANNE|nr:hypothetical protein LSH36_61g00029 [Paralvinella palmiformis]
MHEKRKLEYLDSEESGDELVVSLPKRRFCHVQQFREGKDQTQSSEHHKGQVYRMRLRKTYTSSCLVNCSDDEGDVGTSMSGRLDQQVMQELNEDVPAEEGMFETNALCRYRCSTPSRVPVTESNRARVNERLAVNTAAQQIADLNDGSSIIVPSSYSFDKFSAILCSPEDIIRQTLPPVGKHLHHSLIRNCIVKLKLDKTLDAKSGFLIYS